MLKSKPSSRWMLEERLEVIAELSSILINQLSLDTGKYVAVCERIHLVAAMPRRFLEENRMQLLEDI